MNEEEIESQWISWQEMGGCWYCGVCDALLNKKEEYCEGFDEINHPEIFNPHERCVQGPPVSKEFFEKIQRKWFNKQTECVCSLPMFIVIT